MSRRSSGEGAGSAKGDAVDNMLTVWGVRTVDAQFTFTLGEVSLTSARIQKLGFMTRRVAEAVLKERTGLWSPVDWHVTVGWDGCQLKASRALASSREIRSAIEEFGLSDKAFLRAR